MMASAISKLMASAISKLCNVLDHLVQGSDRRDDGRSSVDEDGQANKGRRWMPWRQEAMKDVCSCEMLRGAANKALIRRSPNGETRLGSCPVIPH